MTIYKECEKGANQPCRPGTDKACKVCFAKCEQSPQAEQATVSSLSDLLCAAKVKKEKTPSGWEQTYVEIRILKFDFKRIYHTEDAATRCAEKINKLLANGT